MAEKIKVLYVDDEENNLISFKANFRMDYKVFTAISGEEALQVLEKQKIDIIITDQRMPNLTGVEFLEMVIEKNPEPMRILLTGYADMSAVIDAVNRGKIYHYLAKPWDEEEMHTTIKNAYEALKKKREIDELNKKLETSNDQLEFMLRQKLLD